MPQPIMALPAYLFAEWFRVFLPVGPGLAVSAMIRMALVGHHRFRSERPPDTGRLGAEPTQDTVYVGRCWIRESLTGSADSLAKLKPAFRMDGTITVGNAPGLNSAAAATIVTTRDFADKHDLEVFARPVSTGVGAVDPGMFGLGPVPAVHQALDWAGWPVSDIERAEINEAFAAIAIALTQELGLSEDIVNVEGGAIAHGHPVGATGAILATRLLHSMKRDSLRRGLVTLCIGGGQGIALPVERDD